MASAYIQKRRGKRGMRYRAVLEWAEHGKPKFYKESWTRYWKRANAQVKILHADAEDIRLGLKKPKAKHTWTELTKRWTSSRVERAAKTRSEYDAPMVAVTTAFWKDCDLCAITKERCGDLREFLRSEGYAETSVKMRLQALKTCLFFALDELEWITKNPMVGVEIPAGADSERIYSDSEFHKLLKAAEEGLKAPLILARYRGMRRGEVLMLAEEGSKKMLWKDEDGEWWVRLRKMTRFGIRSDRNLKTKRKGERDVHIPHEALPYMDLNGTEGAVLPRLTTNTLRFMWERLRAKTGLTGRWHDWKHTAVTRILEEGGQLTDVKRLTGNTLDSLQRYEHIGNRAAKDRIKRFSSPTQIPTQEHPAAKGNKGKKKNPRRESESGRPGSNREPPGPKAESIIFPIDGDGACRRCPTCGQSAPVGIFSVQ